MQRHLTIHRTYKVYQPHKVPDVCSRNKISLAVASIVYRCIDSSDTFFSLYVYSAILNLHSFPYELNYINIIWSISMPLIPWHQHGVVMIYLLILIFDPIVQNAYMFVRFGVHVFLQCMWHGLPLQGANKQRVLMHGHQGWNVRHGLCHICMIYVYVWVVYSFCLFCCLFIIVTTQFVALYKPCKPKPKPSTYDPPDNHPLAEIQRPILRPEPKQQICHQHANTDHFGK